MSDDLVERFLGAFLMWAEEQGPNSAVADNARRTAENMVAAARKDERERCAKIADRYGRGPDHPPVWLADEIAAKIRKRETP